MLTFFLQQPGRFNGALNIGQLFAANQQRLHQPVHICRIHRPHLTLKHIIITVRIFTIFFAAKFCIMKS